MGVRRLCLLFQQLTLQVYILNNYVTVSAGSKSAYSYLNARRVHPYKRGGNADGWCSVRGVLYLKINKGQQFLSLDMNEPYSPEASSPRNTKGIIFAVALFCYQVMACFIYGFRIDYQTINSLQFSIGDIIHVVVLIILAIVGFALLNSYITTGSFSGIGMSLLLFAITVQHWFFIRAFWYKAGTSHQDSTKTWQELTNYTAISFVAFETDTYQFPSLTHDSFAEAIICAICLILALSAVIGRIQFLQVLVLSLFGTFFYEVNSQLFFRLRIEDSGYGMRVFLFAGVLGLVSSVLLGKKQTTANHQGYYSSYASRGIALLGFVFTFCAFPYITATTLYNTTVNRGIILFSGVLNMYFALGAGVLGSFVACALTYRKIHVFDLIYNGLAGGIIYSSTVDLHRNPAVPLTTGFIMGLVCTLIHNRIFRSGNSQGVAFSLPVINRLIVPGIFAGILDAIIVAVNQGSADAYIKFTPNYRTVQGHAAFQLIGILLTTGIALLAGLIVGVLYKIINSNTAGEQFNDNALYVAEEEERKYLNTGTQVLTQSRI